MRTKRAILPLLVIVIALGLTVVLVKSRKVPEPLETPYQGPLVETVTVVKSPRRVVVFATGTARSPQEVNLTPQVRGRVSELSPNMVEGGRFRRGELLFAIESVDYELAIDLAKASLAQAELELQRNENLARVARQEWQALNRGSNEEPDPLVVYEPQLKSARAQRDAAAANVRQAEINLQRTRLYAPFNGYVRSEQLELGQYLNAGSAVATVAGTDQVEIVVPVTLDDLAWLQVPRDGGGQKGSVAEIELQSGDRSFHWQGVITRALGEIDPHNRTANVVVTVTDPLAKEDLDTSPLNQLQPGMFVEVRLQGQQLADVIVVPRGALRDNDTVWIADPDNRLQIRAVDIVRRERDEILVRAGLRSGEQVILTNLTGAADGMLLRPSFQESGQ